MFFRELFCLLQHILATEQPKIHLNTKFENLPFGWTKCPKTEPFFFEITLEFVGRECNSILAKECWIHQLQGNQICCWRKSFLCLNINDVTSFYARSPHFGCSHLSALWSWSIQLVLVVGQVKCDLLPQNERKGARLHTEVLRVKHVTKQQKTKENQYKILIFAGQKQGAILTYHISF